MKKNLLLTLFGLLSLLLISCDNSNIDGKTGDEIELSQKTATFSSESNSITITTGREGWWLEAISLNNVLVDLSKVDKLSKNFIVTNSEFQVERKDGKTIIITMSKNTTNAERVLTIGLEAGDYFDGIGITQSK
jgi:hypothetical protein